MTNRTLEINLEHVSYQIRIEKGILDSVVDYIYESKDCRKIAIITDHNLERLYSKRLDKSIAAKGFRTRIISFEPGEQSKTLESLACVYAQLADFKITRSDMIITLGGGVVGDLGGFAAATYLRGIPYIQIPTSLLAQVDSSIGGKVAVDLPSGKNLVGNFYHPKAVFIDPELLQTLDSRYLHDGLAEVIKYGCIRDSGIMKQLDSYENDEQLIENIDDIIYKCCSIKKTVVEKDEKDFGERMLLNFGHTIGHAIEKYYNFERFSHGEAIAIGMSAITRTSEKLGITEKGTTEKLERLLAKYELPTAVTDIDMKSVFNLIGLDKKVGGGGISLILLNKIGEAVIKKVQIDELETYISV